MESRITEAWDEAKQAAPRVRLFINNVSNDHPFYYGLVFTVIMIYMPAATSSPLLSLRSPAWKDVTGPGWQLQPAAANSDRDGKKQVGSRGYFYCLLIFLLWLNAHKWKLSRVPPPAAAAGLWTFITKLLLIFSTLCQVLKRVKRVQCRVTGQFDRAGVTVAASPIYSQQCSLWQDDLVFFNFENFRLSRWKAS